MRCLGACPAPGHIKLFEILKLVTMKLQRNGKGPNTFPGSNESTADAMGWIKGCSEVGRPFFYSPTWIQQLFIWLPT